jgi:hypothetical protein
MADDKEYRYYRGEGGVVWELELPLSPEMADQVRLGRMIEVPKPEDVGDDTQADGRMRTAVAMREPAPHEPKSVWVDYAVANGWSYADAQNASRNELVEKLAKKEETRKTHDSGADTAGRNKKA